MLVIIFVKFSLLFLIEDIQNLHAWKFLTLLIHSKTDIENYYVYTNLEARAGNYYYANKEFIHPDYKTDINVKAKYDIALIKLKEKIPMDLTIDYQNIGTICLPSKSFSVKRNNLARSAGFGPLAKYLQISTYSVVKLNRSYLTLWIYSLINKHQICHVFKNSSLTILII